MTFVIVVLNLPVPDDARVWMQGVALRDAGHDVVIVCPALRGHRPGVRRVDGIDVRYFRAFEGRSILMTLAEGMLNTLHVCWITARLLRTREVASLQVCNPPDSLFPLLRWARRRGCATVYDQHDAVPVLAEEKFSARWLQRIFWWMERATVRAADTVLTPSDEQRRRIEREHVREAVVVRTAPPVHEVAEPTSPDGRELRLGYLGVIGEQDGLPDLVEAFASLGALGDGVTLSIAGDGPALPKVKQLAEERGLLDRITFEGWLDRSEVPRFLDAIDVMVVPDAPSPFNHLCAMNKVTHAMAAGHPVVYRPLRENLNVTGGLGYVAANDELDGFVSAIEAFLEDSEEGRRRVGRELRRRYVEELSWTVQEQRYLRAVGAVGEAEVGR